MTAKLMPQLPRSLAVELASTYASAEVDDLSKRASDRHERQVYSPTGGHQVTPIELHQLALAVRQLRETTTPATFDARLVRIVHPWLSITRQEAGLEGVWSFLGCVLLPDVVRWRFSGEATPADRFLGDGRGVRNVFGRAWWRGEMLRDPDPPPGRDAYWLVDELSEDELTGIVERQRAVTSSPVALALGRALCRTDCRGFARMDVAREGLKLFLRLGYFVEYDALEDDELRIACESLFRRSVKQLSAREAPRV